MAHGAAMDRGTALFPAYSLGAVAQGIRDAFGEVVAMLFGGKAFRDRAELESETLAVVEPHLAILVHKRARYLAPAEDGTVRHQRWDKELDDFVGRTFFWPLLAPTEAFGTLNRAQIALIVDRIVVRERDRQSAAAAMLPATSRFDSSWAD